MAAYYNGEAKKVFISQLQHYALLLCNTFEQIVGGFEWPYKVFGSSRFALPTAATFGTTFAQRLAIDEFKVTANTTACPHTMPSLRYVV